MNNTIQHPISTPVQRPQNHRLQGPVTQSQVQIPGPLADRVDLSESAFGETGRSVTVQRYSRRPGGADASTLEGILLSQGHTRQEIYSGERGHRLIDRVAQANSLKDPNLIRPGQRLMVPASEARLAEERQRLDAMLPPDQYSDQAPQIGPDLRPQADDRNADGRVDLHERLRGNLDRRREDRRQFCEQNPQIPRAECMPQP